jgi:hypothetical protein
VIAPGRHTNKVISRSELPPYFRGFILKVDIKKR